MLFILRVLAERKQFRVEQLQTGIGAEWGGELVALRAG